MMDEGQIDIIINGLKALYEKLTLKDKEPLQNDQDPNQHLKFDSESDKCLESLKELFIYRLKQSKEKRMEQNKNCKALRSVSRIFWVTRIFVYLDLEDALKLNQVCVYFNQLIKSPLFIKFMVQINERTKIDISLNTFETEEHKVMNSARNQIVQMMKSGGKLPQNETGRIQKSNTVVKSGEDRDAQIEVLRNTKIFLTNKIKDNEKIIMNLQKDLETMKDLVRIEKQTKQKSQQLLSSKEKELDELRKEFLEKEQENKSKINELQSQLQERDRQLDAINSERKKLKIHKKVFKEEVMRLRQELNELEQKNQSKSVALKSLADFFNNQTLQKVKQFTKEEEDDEIQNEI